IQQGPENIGYYMNLAGSYSHLRKPEQAKQVLVAMAAHSKTYQDWYWVGHDYYEVGAAFIDFDSFQKAESAFERSLGFGIQTPLQAGLVWNEYGLSQEMLGNYQEAFKGYQNASQRGYAKGGENYARLQNDIQACRIQANKMIYDHWASWG